MQSKESEKLIPLKDVADLPWLPNRKNGKWHIATIYAWVNRGRHGVKLRTVWAGGLCTTERWLMEFFSAAAGQAIEQAEEVQSKERDSAIARAERELDAAGV